MQTSSCEQVVFQSGIGLGQEAKRASPVDGSNLKTGPGRQNSGFILRPIRQHRMESSIEALSSPDTYRTPYHPAQRRGEMLPCSSCNMLNRRLCSRFGSAIWRQLAEYPGSNSFRFCRASPAVSQIEHLRLRPQRELRSSGPRVREVGGRTSRSFRC
jgi:hypothetical protein